MPAGVAFSDILEEKLRGPEADGRRHGAHAELRRAPHPGVYLTSPLFQSAAIQNGAAKAAYGVPARPQHAGPVRLCEPLRVEPPPPSSPIPRRRRRRTLSAPQQKALVTLVGLGAGIDAGFTQEELRTAFRTLARVYHPDRHPGTGEGEKASLSLLFAQLYDAYRQLRTVRSPAP